MTPNEIADALEDYRNSGATYADNALLDWIDEAIAHLRAPAALPELPLSDPRSILSVELDKLSTALLGMKSVIVRNPTIPMKCAEQIDDAINAYKAIRAYALAALAGREQDAAWIGVEERMPEPYEDVLVWPYPSDYCLTAQWWKQKGKWQYGDYITGYGHEWVEARGITHWMPLPSAPAAIAGEKKE